MPTEIMQEDQMINIQIEQSSKRAGLHRPYANHVVARASLVFIALFLGGDALSGSEAINTKSGKSESVQDSVKRVLIYAYSDGPKQQFFDVDSRKAGYLSWLVNDPLIISAVKVEVAKSLCTNKYPDLSKQVLSSYDLVVVSFPHTIKTEYIADLIGFINGKGALFLVQPSFETPDQAASVLGPMGTSHLGTEKATFASSLITDHPAARILGLSEGKSVYPHRMDLPHTKYSVVNGAILTRLSLGGDPDLFITANPRVAIVATDIMDDVRTAGPDHPESEKNFRYLFINTLRGLMGLGMLNQPVQEPMQRFGELFYAYRCGRDYVVAAHQESPFSTRLSNEELQVSIDKADSGIRQAAMALVQGKFTEARGIYDGSVKVLSGCMDRMTKVNRYIIRGWHGSILTPDYYGGGLLGYAEPEWQDRFVQWMRKQLDWASRTGSRRLIDIYPNDWELLSQYYPEDIQRFKEAIKDGRLEAVNGIFSAAWLPILLEESNVRQFSYGLKGYSDVLDAKVRTFICAADHYDFHPQLPQILKGFDYSNAILKNSSRIDSEIIRWRGLDDTELDAIQKIHFSWANPGPVAEADKRGYKSILLGTPAFDAGTDLTAERESTLIDPIAPVFGTWVNAKELFERVPRPEHAVFMGVDELWANNLAMWSGWGCMNESCGWNRVSENLLLAAEKLMVIAAATGKISRESARASEERIHAAWKNLLQFQDHMLFGPVDYTHQELPKPASEAGKPGAKQWVPVGGAGLVMQSAPGAGKSDNKHWFGYDFPAMPLDLKVVGNGAMENYGETCAANYGGPMIPGSRYKRSARCITDSQDASGSVVDAMFRSLVGEDQRPQARMSGSIPVIVFNQTGWNRKDVVSLEREFPPGATQHVTLSHGKNPIPLQFTRVARHNDGSLKTVKAIFIDEIPALGYKVYHLNPADAPADFKGKSVLSASSSRLENNYYTIDFDARHGGMTRILDKQLGVEMIDAGKIGNELFSLESPAASSKDTPAKIELVEQGPWRATVRIRSTIGEAPYESLISIYSEIKRIDCDLTVDYGKAGLNFGEKNKTDTGLFVRFPLNYAGNLYVNQPFGVYETKKDHQVALDFADLYQGKYGFALIQGNTPNINYKQSVLSLCLTRGRFFVVGNQRYPYSIYTHKENPFLGDLYTVAKSVNMPFIAHWPSNQVADMAPTASYITIDKPNIVLSSLLSVNDVVYARLFERSGKATHVSIEMPFIKSSECWRVKLNHERIEKVDVSNGKIRLVVKPWEIVTISLPGNL
jgi:hypothetical protein